jgi:putative ABC transport system permease protein
MTRGKTLLRLALADLWAERVMALCLVVGVAAVLTPLLLMASLKIGFIDRMREELIADPAFRELRPGDAALKDQDFIAALTGMPEVEFAVLSTMMVPREVIFRPAGGRDRFEARLLPSGPGDPLLARTGAATSLGPGEVVMSARLAAEAGLRPGDLIELMVFRTMTTARDQATTELVLRGLLPDEQTPKPVILADAALDSAVESWRSGLSVPALGWAGADVPMPEQYDALLLAVDSPLTPYELRDVELRMGTDPPRPWPVAEYRAEVGLEGLMLPATAALDKAVLYRLDRSSGVFHPSDLKAIHEVLSSRRIVVSGLTPPIPVEGHSIAPVDFMLLGFACGNHCLKTDTPLSGFEVLPVHAAEAGDPLALPRGPNVPRVQSQIALPSGVMLADWRLGGVMRAAADKGLAYDPTSNRFVEAAAGTRGFRVVARDLDAVVPVAQAIRALGFEVQSREEDVLRLQRLDRVLNLLVALVAAVSLTGGFAVLGINSFANVQRKIGDFAVLRLLGLSRRATFVLPLLQALVVALVGLALSLLIFAGLAAYLNGPVAAGLGIEGKLALLRPGHLALTCGVMVMGSLIACAASAVHATRADPAVALKSQT